VFQRFCNPAVGRQNGFVRHKAGAARVALLHRNDPEAALYGVIQQNGADRRRIADHAVAQDGDVLRLNVELDAEFVAYLKDLLTYGLTRYFIDFGEETGFKLWQSYRMDQVQQLFLKNPKYNAVGTYYYDNKVIIFASLKKDASVEERLAYQDKFLDINLFQWESMANVRDSDVQKQINSENAYLFIRKVSEENGVVLPFIYVGKGKMTNPRLQQKTDAATGKMIRTYLYDIVMENDLPDYLQYDFGLVKGTPPQSASLTAPPLKQGSLFYRQ